MYDAYEIEKGFPIPGYTKRGLEEEEKIKNTLRIMEVGDSFVCSEQAMSLATNLSRELSIKLEYQQIPFIGGACRTYRVWRIELTS